MEEDVGGAVSTWRVFRALVPQSGTRLAEYLIVIGAIALGAQISLRLFNTMSRKTKEQVVTVSSESSACVGGLCTVQAVPEADSPKAP